VVCVADHVGLGFRVVIVTDLDPEWGVYWIKQVKANLCY
jgi:hypothetical protein